MVKGVKQDLKQKAIDDSPSHSSNLKPSPSVMKCKTSPASSAGLDSDHDDVWSADDEMEIIQAKFHYPKATVDGRKARGGCQTANDSYAKALSCLTKEEALKVIQEEQPKDYLRHFRTINANLERIFSPPIVSWEPPFQIASFNQVPKEMQEWADNYFGLDSAARPRRPKSIIIEGGSRTGKTMWARSLGKHNYLCGHLDLNPKTYNNDVEYNVIDDVNPQFLKYWKEIIGAKEGWQSNCKHGKPLLIKGGIPAIVLCKPGLGSSYKEYLDKAKNTDLKNWTLINAVFIFLKEPLFSTTSSQ